MPIEVRKTEGGDAYINAFLSITTGVNFQVDVSTLTVAEVDESGTLKPCVPLQATGALISAPGQVAYAVTIEAQKLPGRTDNADLATDTTDPILAGAMGGTINRDIAEDVLGRAYTADELSALAAGGFKLTRT